jgi:uncharacterized protein YjiS (DUF1127 family)
LQAFGGLQGDRNVSKTHSSEIQQSRQIGHGFLVTVREALKTLADKIVYGHQLRCDFLHLSAMSDPELQDIGISRSDISAVLAGTYQRVERPRPKANASIKLAVPIGGNSRGRRRTSCAKDSTKKRTAKSMCGTLRR